MPSSRPGGQQQSQVGGGNDPAPGLASPSTGTIGNAGSSGRPGGVLWGNRPPPSRPWQNQGKDAPAPPPQTREESPISHSATVAPIAINRRAEEELLQRQRDQSRGLDQEDIMAEFAEIDKRTSGAPRWYEGGCGHYRPARG